MSLMTASGLRVEMLSMFVIPERVKIESTFDMMPESRSLAHQVRRHDVVQLDLELLEPADIVIDHVCVCLALLIQGLLGNGLAHEAAQDRSSLEGDVVKDILLFLPALLEISPELFDPVP